MFEARIDFSQLNERIQSARESIGKLIVGQQQMIDLLLVAILSEGHVLIEGVPGVAKTLSAKLLAEIVDAGFSRIQFTPDLMPSDVTGSSVYLPAKGIFEFRNGPVFANIILTDEINRAPAKTQAALFEVMEERQVTYDGVTYPMSYPFMVVATQNPIDQEGTYRLPEAQLDRFMFKILVSYPDTVQEVEIMQRHNNGLFAQTTDLPKVLNADIIRNLRSSIQSVYVKPDLLEYIAQIVAATRGNPALYLGASPRASIALLNGTKAWAAMQGRDFITPEDIQELAYPVLRHRIMLSPEKEMEGSSPDDMVRQIIQKIEVPR
ncbi:MAG: MoxR family ATPase [Bacteroidales bacterium]|jgi:MoxR-like ATPase|nr:MoxR family ATPase [Bacteroidales bacterium]